MPPTIDQTSVPQKFNGWGTVSANVVTTLLVLLFSGARGEPAKDEFLHDSAEHALSCSDGEVSEN